jgi:2-keto-4-pentenoate hydratase/2-oxohepta-3-ene-1,7-dioic acid hydratase in catechol pathway
MRLVQYERNGRPQVGRVLEGDLVAPLRRPADLDPDQAVLALAMGQIKVEQSGPELELAALRTAAPIRRPGAVRDFLLYEAHLANGLRPYNRPVPPAWYREPSFYFTCPHTIVGSGADLRRPPTQQLDFELELAVVIGRELRDPSRAEALDAIAGFTLFNDFSLRDVQAGERTIGLGPMKSKDFGSALGPYLVTPDELGGDRAQPRLTVQASVNDEIWTRSRTDDLYFDLAAAIMQAARDSLVRPGDVIATGTVPMGCVLELLALEVEGPHRWLRPDDHVVISAEGLGALVTHITS